MFLHNFSWTITSWTIVLWHSNCHYNEFCRCIECRYKEDWLYLNPSKSKAILWQMWLAQTKIRLCIISIWSWSTLFAKRIFKIGSYHICDQCSSIWLLQNLLTLNTSNRIFSEGVGQAWANSVDPDQTPQNAASDIWIWSTLFATHEQFYTHSP